MSEPKPRKWGIIVALLLVAGSAAAFALLGGPAVLADLLASDAAEPSTEPVTPAGTDAGSADATSTPTEDVAVSPEQLGQMYWEQVASQAQIVDLVEDEFASFAIGTPTKSGSIATVPVEATYRDGGQLAGELVLRQIDRRWFFTMITREGHDAVTPSGDADTAIIETAVAAQVRDQEIPTAIVNGEFTKLTVKDVTVGAGTKTVNISLSGKRALEGSITCVSKVVGGRTYWFMTSFAK